MTDDDLYRQLLKDFDKPGGTGEEDPERFERAAKAYRRAGGTQQPARDHTLIRRYGNTTGIVLCNCNGPLTAYRYSHQSDRLRSITVREADRQCSDIRPPK